MSEGSSDPGASADRARRRQALSSYHGPRAEDPDPGRRVGWRGRADQRLRFAVCAAARGLEACESALDVGCGLGDLAPFLRQRGFGGRYLGVDLLREMVDAARARHPGEAFEVADICAPDPHPALAGRRFGLVVACGALSLRVPEYGAAFEAALRGLWRHTAGALVLVLPSTRARRRVAGLDETLALHDPARLRARLLSLSPWVVIREDYLPTDVAAYVYRDASPAHAALERDASLTASERALLYLERELPARALAVLEAAEAAAAPDGLGAEALLRRGQALRRLGAEAPAAAALRAALALDPSLLEARLELEGLDPGAR